MSQADSHDDFLFLGTHFGVADGNGRVNIPADFRRSLEENGESELIFNPGGDGSLNAFPRKVFSRYWASADPFGASFAEDDSLPMNFAIHGNSFRKQVDSQGRVTLPEAIFKRSKDRRDIVFFGCRDHFVIWDKESFDIFQEKKSIPPEEAWKKHREMRKRLKEL